MSRRMPTFVVAWMQEKDVETLEKYPGLIAPNMIWAMGIEKPPKFLRPGMNQDMLRRRVEDSINRVRTQKPRPSFENSVSVRVQDSDTRTKIFEGEVKIPDKVVKEIQDPEVESGDWRRI